MKKELSVQRNMKKRQILERMWNNRFLYLLLLPSVAYIIFFNYIPFNGVKIAFQNYNIFSPELSEWVGLDNFKQIFSNSEIYVTIWNTLLLSLLTLVTEFPITIIFALLINEVTSSGFKKTVQTISYLPHFLSWISVIGIATALYSRDGLINNLISMITGSTTPILFMSEQWFFIPDVIILSIWKEMGWGSILYLAAITGVDESLYEAAMLDGAGRLKQVWHITLPSILPTIVIMLIWRIGGLLGSNFELVYGLQNPFINFEVISTFIYKRGIAGGDYAISTAYGLFNGVVNAILLILANYFAKKTTEVGIF